MANVKTIRWGILATGGIALAFTRDLLVDPKTRGVDDVRHTVAAAASSSSQQRAQQFLDEVKAPPSARAYGSYEELVADQNVDIVYVATPHSHHFQNAMLCLEAGKNVLCEKAFTVNAAQTKLLIRKAADKGLFLAEAVWTRYFPLSAYVRELITSGRLGVVHRVQADLSNLSAPEENYADGQHRMVNMGLAGGALLDLGIYALTWCFQALYSVQDRDARRPPSVLAALNKWVEGTGCDEQTTVLLSFPRDAAHGGNAHAIAMTGLRTSPDPQRNGAAGPAVRIQGSKGEVQVFHPIFRPTRTKLVLADGTAEEKHWPQPGPGAGSGWYNGFGSTMNAEGEGHGMFWEADDAARALVNGKRKEGGLLPWEESTVIMEVMDEVRRQGGLIYPHNVETTDYPVRL